MKRRNPYTLTEGENMQRKNSGKVMHYLVAVCALVSALALVACGGGGGGDDGGTTVTSGETLSSVNSGSVPLNGSNAQAVVGQQFTIPNGSIFDPAIGANQSATFAFTRTDAFRLDSGNSTASGSNAFGSCTLTVAVSNFPTVVQGLQAGKAITFTTCSIQITASNVTVGGGSVNGTLTLTLSGPNGSSTSIAITVQISILTNGTLVVNGVSTGIIISSTGSPTTTGTTGTGGQ